MQQTCKKSGLCRIEWNENCDAKCLPPLSRGFRAYTLHMQPLSDPMPSLGSKPPSLPFNDEPFKILNSETQISEFLTPSIHV